MTNESLDTLLCRVVVTWQKEDPKTNNTIYGAGTWVRVVKEAVNNIKQNKYPLGKVSLYTLDEKPLLIAVFPEHLRKENGTFSFPS